MRRKQCHRIGCTFYYYVRIVWFCVVFNWQPLTPKDYLFENRYPVRVFYTCQKGG